MSSQLHEVALSPVEVERILAVCGTRALLVGGQSLAFWALYYNVRPVGVLSEAVTMHVDFIGTAETATLLVELLGKPWTLRKGTLDDPGAQIAKVYAVLPGNGLKQVDFLTGIVGLDSTQVAARAVEVETPGGAVFRVLHPLDVLESRLRNLSTLPAKQNPFGIAQAKLAVQVVGAFIEHSLTEAQRPRVVFQAIRRVTQLALDPRLAETTFEHDIAVLSAVPVEKISTPEFRERRWPDILARLARRRSMYEARKAKRATGEQ